MRQWKAVAGSGTFFYLARSNEQDSHLPVLRLAGEVGHIKRSLKESLL